MQRGDGCCIQTVREAAQRSLLSDEAVVELTIETFMNIASDALTDRERIRLLTASPDARAMYPFPLPENAAHAVYEIGVRATDSELRAKVWSMLGWNGLNSEFAQAIVVDLVAHPSQQVQRSAVIALTSNVNVTDVRDIVQRALSEDLSAENRQTLISALQGGRP